MRLIDADELSSVINRTCYVPVCVDCMTKHNIIEIIERQPTAYDVADNELRILRNHIEQMPKVYRKRNANWVIVQNLLMARTSRAGQTSSIEKCWELNIDAYGYELIAKGGEQDD